MFWIGLEDSRAGNKIGGEETTAEMVGDTLFGEGTIAEMAWMHNFSRMVY